MQGVCPMRVSQVCYGASYVNVTQVSRKKCFVAGKKIGLSNIFFDIVEKRLKITELPESTCPKGWLTTHPQHHRSLPLTR